MTSNRYFVTTAHPSRAKLMGDIALLQTQNALLQTENAQWNQDADNLELTYTSMEERVQTLEQQLTDKQTELDHARDKYRRTLLEQNKYYERKIVNLTKGGDLLLEFLRDHVNFFGYYRDSGIIITIHHLVAQAENLIHPQQVLRESGT